MREKKYRHHKVDCMNNIHEFEHELYILHNINTATTNKEFREKLKRLIFHGLKYWITARQKQIMTMYYVDNLTQQQIAKELKINKSAVCRTIKNAKKILQKYCEPYFTILK